MKSSRNWVISGSIFFIFTLHLPISRFKSGKLGLTKYVILLYTSWLQVAVTISIFIQTGCLGCIKENTYTCNKRRTQVHSFLLMIHLAFCTRKDSYRPLNVNLYNHEITWLIKRKPFRLPSLALHSSSTGIGKKFKTLPVLRCSEMLFTNPCLTPLDSCQISSEIGLHIKHK